MTRSTIDAIGLSTLENLRGMDRLNDWMFATIRPWLQGNILEIGSGIGNISAQLIAHGIPLSLSDYSEHYCNVLRHKFRGEPMVRGIYPVDLVQDCFETTYSGLCGQFDTIFAMNVVEHIGNDQLAIGNAWKLLVPGGRLIVLVPACPALYNGLDKELEHFRRYTRTSLSGLFCARGFEVLHSRYFNLAGMAGWFITGTLQKKKSLPAESLAFYNRCVPFFRLLDRLSFHLAGLSVIVAGRKVVGQELQQE